MKPAAAVNTSTETSPGTLFRVVTRRKVLEEATTAYSAQSTSELTQGFLDLRMSEAVGIVGVILGPILWIFLKSCPENTKKEILEFLSPFRSGFKSVAVLQNTGAMSGLQALRSPTAIIVGGVVGAGVGLLLTKYIQEKIKTIETSFNQSIKLNQLLAKHIETNTDPLGPRIPAGLDDEALIRWLGNPHYSPELNFVPVDEHCFKTISEEELNRYYWFVLFNEIVNGTYTDSVANTDLTLMGLGAAVTSYAGLALNTVLLSGLIYTYFKIAQYKVDGFALRINFSCSKVKTALKKREFEEATTGSTCQAQSVVNEKYTALVEAESEQRRREQALVDYQKNKPRKTYLLNAGLKGFQMGGMMTQATMGTLFGILALAHVISLAIPPVFITLLLTEIVVGGVCAYLSYKQREKALDEEDAKEAEETQSTQSISAEQPVAATKSVVTPADVELTTFNTSSDSEVTKVSTNVMSLWSAPRPVVSEPDYSHCAAAAAA